MVGGAAAAVGGAVAGVFGGGNADPDLPPAGGALAWVRACATTAEDASADDWAALDWSIRTALPEWLDAAAAASGVDLSAEARDLRAADPVTGPEPLEAVQPALGRAESAAAVLAAAASGGAAEALNRDAEAAVRLGFIAVDPSFAAPVPEGGEALRRVAAAVGCAEAVIVRAACLRSRPSAARLQETAAEALAPVRARVRRLADEHLASEGGAEVDDPVQSAPSP